jgi:hypothetical protein
VIRAAFLLTVALTLGTGDSVLLVCRALCDRAAPAAAEACGHTEPATQPAITTNPDCTTVGLPSTAAIGNDAPRPGLSISGHAESIVIAPATAAIGHACAPGASVILRIELRTVALRI